MAPLDGLGMLGITPWIQQFTSRIQCSWSRSVMYPIRAAVLVSHCLFPSLVDWRLSFIQHSNLISRFNILALYFVKYPLEQSFPRVYFCIICQQGAYHHLDGHEVYSTSSHTKHAKLNYACIILYSPSPSYVTVLPNKI